VLTWFDTNPTWATGKTYYVTISDAVDPSPTLTMTTATTSTTCNNTRTFGTYSSQSFSTEADNGKYICYK